MFVPNIETAQVSEEKIRQYLLNTLHPDGSPKARFFALMGFRAEEWPVLAQALIRQASQSPITSRVESKHGCKYVVDGGLETPIGRTPRIRTVWIVDAGASIPRLVTAYPQEGEAES
jgi:hypothetical protein